MPQILRWDKLKKKHSLRLCFSCDERYLPGQKYKQSLTVHHGKGGGRRIREWRYGRRDPDIKNHTPRSNRLGCTNNDYKSEARAYSYLSIAGLHTNLSVKKRLKDLNWRRHQWSHLKFELWMDLHFNIGASMKKYRSKLETQFKVTLYALPLVSLDLVMGV